MKMKTVVVGVVEDVVAEDLDMVVVDTGNEDDGEKSLLSFLFFIFLSVRDEHSAGVSSFFVSRTCEYISMGIMLEGMLVQIFLS